MTLRYGEAAEVIRRLQGMIHNHPKIEYLRLTRREAEVLIKSLDEQQEPCPAVIHMGPGHQSRGECELSGPHNIHRNTLTGSVLEWEGMEAFTGFFGESPL